MLYGSSEGDAHHWEWDGADWTPVWSPPAVGGAAMAFDDARQRVVMFGGYGVTAEGLGGTAISQKTVTKKLDAPSSTLQ